MVDFGTKKRGELEKISKFLIKIGAFRKMIRN